MANLSSSIEHLMKLIGCECIYKESGLVLHAQLIAININGDMLELKFKRLPSPGFTPRNIRTFTCSSVMEYLSFGKNRICGSLINQEIFFRKSDVKEIVQFMATRPDAGSFIRKLREYRKI
jgi:hypothetical protein